MMDEYSIKNLADLSDVITLGQGETLIRQGVIEKYCFLFIR